MSAPPPGGGSAASRGMRGALPGLGALVAAWLLLFAPAFLGAGQFLYRDAGRMHHPMKRWIAEELRRGHLPEWNPFAGMGVPVLGTAVDAPLHPFNALLVALPFELAFKAWVLLSVLLAGCGAALWARRLGARGAAATAAGLAFMLSGFVVSSTDNLTYLTTLAAAPWLLAAAHAAARALRPGPLALVGLASFVTAAGGDPMGWAVAVGLAALQPLLDEQPPRERLLRAFAVGAVSALAAAPVILPVLAWIPASSRGGPLPDGEYLRWNLHPLRLLELLVPHLFRGRVGNLYAGVYAAYAGNEYSTIPWVVSVYAGASTVALALFGATRDRRARWLLIGALLFAWMAMGPYAGFGPLARHLPILGNFRFWEKLVVWVALLVATAAAFGVAALAQQPGAGRGLAKAAGGVGGLLLLAHAVTRLAAAPLAEVVRVGDRRRIAEGLVSNAGEGTLAAGVALLLLAAVAWLTARGRLGRLAPAALLLVLALDLAGANVRAYMLSAPSLVTEPAPVADRLRSLAGQGRVLTPFRRYPERWPELTDSDGRARWWARSAGSAWNVPLRFSNFEPYTGMIPARLDRLLAGASPEALVEPSALFGFDHVVVPDAPERAAQLGLAPPYDVQAVDPDLPVFLLGRAARPRAALAGPLRQVDARGAEAFARSGGRADGDGSVVEGTLPAGYRPPHGEARLVVDEGERLRVECRASGEALLIVNDTDAPGWRAEVDGHPAPIVAANYLARGVWVPAGTHVVELRYRTPGLLPGLLLAAALGCTLAALALNAARRRHREPPIP